MMIIKQQIMSFMFICYLFFISNCAFKKDEPQPPFTPSLVQQTLVIPEMPLYQSGRMPSRAMPAMPLTAAPILKHAMIEHERKGLDFEVENRTGKTIFVTCFSYTRRNNVARWRWEKSPIYEIGQGQRGAIAVSDVEDPRDRKNVFGYLALFNTFNAAQDAVYELLPDNVQIDLDQLEKLKDKCVVIEVEKYGAKGMHYEYDFIKKKVDRNNPDEQENSLDFPIENRTGRPVFVVCFTYQKQAKGYWFGALGGKDDMALWHYAKEPILKLMPNQTDIMHVTRVAKGRDHIYVQGFLGVFSENEAHLADAITYERLPSKRRLALGRLFQLEGKKVVLDVEKYGIANDVIDYRIKPTQHIDFTKIKGPRKDFLKETVHYETINETDRSVPA